MKKKTEVKKEMPTKKTTPPKKGHSCPACGQVVTKSRDSGTNIVGGNTAG